MRKGIVYLLVVGAALFVRDTASADIPKTINFQGRLMSSKSVPFDGTANLTMRIYDSRGNLLFSESQSSVAVTKGIFNVLIGSGTVGGVCPCRSGEFRHPGLAVATDTSIDHPVVGTSVSHSVRATGIWPGNDTLKIMRAVIRYTVSEAE